MWTRDYRNIIGGGVLIVLGVATLIYALVALRLGTVARMGPGFFPAALGVILASLGLGISVPAAFRSGEPMNVDLRTLTFVGSGVIAFALLVRPFGLIPATVVLTLLASRASNTLSPLAIIVTTAVLSIGATLLFQVALGLQVSAFNWPW